eukprot:4983556-Lingulodinium_polyedra.AAC.1
MAGDMRLVRPRLGSGRNTELRPDPRAPLPPPGLEFDNPVAGLREKRRLRARAGLEDCRSELCETA